MINYAKHDEEFYGIFKLVNGDEVLGKAVLTDDNRETICFIQDPVCIQLIHKEIDEGKVARGMGFAKWMQLSDEDFYIIREKDIITVSSMSKEVIIMYESYVCDDDDEKKSRLKTEPDNVSGYQGTIDKARLLFEKLYRHKNS